MFLRMLLPVLLSMPAVVVGAATSAQGAPLQPTAKWVVNFDNAQCIASRNYGSKDQPLYLVFKHPPLGDIMQLAIIENGAAGTPVQLDGTVGFDDQPPLNVSVLLHKPRGAKVRTFLTNLSADQFAVVRTANSLRIKTQGLDQNLALHDVQSLLRVMDDCVLDLRKVWNVTDKQEERSVLSEEARANLRRTFRSSDYPTEALINDQSGSVRVVLLVDEVGKVADCSVIQSSRVAVLDAQTCAILKERGRFRPAVGLDGRPAKSAWIQRISWRTEFQFPDATRIRR